MFGLECSILRLRRFYNLWLQRAGIHILFNRDRTTTAVTEHQKSVCSLPDLPQTVYLEPKERFYSTSWLQMSFSPLGEAQLTALPIP